MQKRAMKNRYDGLLEPWKIRLIISRARRFSFRRQDWEDVQQEVILEVVTFPFDPAKGNAESTPLTALIDNRLKELRRKGRRERARLATRNERCGLYPTIPDKELALSYWEDCSLRLDLTMAMTRLTSEELAVCLRLIQGQSIRQIARQLKRGWHSVNRIVKGIQDRFRAMGLDT